MTDESREPHSLDDLGARLRAARGQPEGESSKAAPRGGGAGMGLGFRIATELVAGIAVGHTHRVCSRWLVRHAAFVYGGVPVF